MKYILLALAILLVGCGQVIEVDLTDTVISPEVTSEHVVTTVRVMSNRIDTQIVQANHGDGVTFQVINLDDRDRIFEIQGLFTQKIRADSSIEFEFIAREGVYNFGFRTQIQKGKLVVN